MHTILHVEDEPAIRAALGHILARAGYEVTWVASAEEALTSLAARGFDAVLTDHRMAGLTGVSVVAAAARMEPRPWIVASSGDADAGLRACYAAAGADRFLAKPFGAAELLAALGSGLSLRRAA